MPTEQQVAVVVLGLVNAALPSTPNDVNAYDASTLPATKPAEFVLVSVVRRPGSRPRAGRDVTSAWALYIQAASQTSVTNARNSLRLAGVALEAKHLTVAGQISTSVEFSTARPVAGDDGWFSGVDEYHFTV